VLALYIGLIGYKLLSKTPEDIAQNLLEQHRDNVTLAVNKLSIDDPHLLACIKKAAMKYERPNLDRPERAIDIYGLKSLYCRQKNIQSLVGIEKFGQLIFLNLSNNRIEDIGPLASNTQLKTLQLAGNPLIGISALRNHTSLEVLTLPKLPNTDCNKIKSILIAATNLRLPPCKQSRSQAPPSAKKNANELTEAFIKESRQLSNKEESEILDYEYEMLRQID